MRGVAITGLGIVSGLGLGPEAHLHAFRAARSGLHPLSLFALPGLPALPVGEVDEETVLGQHPSRSIALALLAARQAAAHQQLSGHGLIAVGTTTGGIHESEQHYLRHRGEEGKADRELLRYHPAGAIADVLASELNVSAERHTFSTACSSSANAIGYGAARIQQGVPWALVGGVDSLCRITYAGFHALKLLSPEPCRPFDRARQGLSLGEGAAFLLLENEGRARSRGVVPLGRVDGWGCTADAYHMTAPHPEGRGALAAMRAALADAGVAASDVDYVNAHGTATLANDRAEGLALGALFKASGPLVSSTKGATGHTLGAAGAMEALFCVLALGAGFAPPTVGLLEPDPSLALRLVPPDGMATPLKVALSNSFGFGGNNAALVLTRAPQ
ncbi:MAG: beta-ketoacyl-[acyl-carrier-protein] synthase family protein [Myxococcaceae bacterium]